MASVTRSIYECPVDYCRRCLEKIRRTAILNSFVTVLENDALKHAEESKKRMRNGILLWLICYCNWNWLNFWTLISTPTSLGTRWSSLDGSTVAIKDNFCMKNVKTTCASKMLQSFIAPYDATVVRKLKESGVIVTGKTNLDEFAMGFVELHDCIYLPNWILRTPHNDIIFRSGTVDSIYGPTKNIWGSPLQKLSSDKFVETNEDFRDWRIAGGSSGGSAVAVATGSVFAFVNVPHSYYCVITYRVVIKFLI